jgi:hypothetical protein
MFVWLGLASAQTTNAPPPPHPHPTPTPPYLSSALLLHELNGACMGHGMDGSWELGLGLIIVIERLVLASRRHGRPH